MVALALMPVERGDACAVGWPGCRCAEVLVPVPPGFTPGPPGRGGVCEVPGCHRRAGAGATCDGHADALGLVGLAGLVPVLAAAAETRCGRGFPGCQCAALVAPIPGGWQALRGRSGVGRPDWLRADCLVPGCHRPVEQSAMCAAHAARYARLERIRRSAVRLGRADRALLRAHPRPARREECAPTGKGLWADRPCPWVGCRHHLWHAQPDPETVDPGDLLDTCALDVADRGEAGIEVIGAALGVTGARASQLVLAALDSMRRHAGSLRPPARERA